MTHKPRTNTDTLEAWPVLPPLSDWQDTLDTVHRWTQIIGKIRLEQGPWINHSWGSALYVTTRGLTTSPIPYEARTFSIDLDFTSHTFRLTSSTGDERRFALRPMSVATFYEQTMGALADLGLAVEISPRPVEIPDPIQPFPEDDQHASYDAEAMQRFWQALVQADRVFKAFRARFLGKVSPVHFFWGAFDLAVTRFSGRDAPPHPGGVPNCADWVMEEAYSQELSSAGFWPGTGLGEAAFYSYAYPEPEGYRDVGVAPDAAYYLEDLGEYVLPYEAVQSAKQPDDVLLSFLQTTYEAAAEHANWDRNDLEGTAEPS